jgi:hypothetical protein
LANRTRDDPDPQEEALLECLEECLRHLPGESRWLLEKYYACGDGDRIASRRALARELGVAANALRNRVLRLREKLESRTAECFHRKCDGRANSSTPEGEEK